MGPELFARYETSAMLARKTRKTFGLRDGLSTQANLANCTLEWDRLTQHGLLHYSQDDALTFRRDNVRDVVRRSETN
ncbi:hypothetical protein CA85_46830 [Allorhodopirellula solitaria]|uniref:Uncharacterized protein n=1 Tax=Allorhodopirellula solitaria TaxID=2527987 RepID=A0A5C5X1E6_9BACT|nr:hypothetical protein CA85_46830 [Allorhodopirellula solitaria]